MRMAEGTIDRMAATSACGLAHPAAAAPLTQRQDGLNNSLVRLVSFVENPLARRAKPTADRLPDAADQPLCPLPNQNPARRCNTTVGRKLKNGLCQLLSSASLPANVVPCTLHGHMFPELWTLLGVVVKSSRPISNTTVSAGSFNQAKCSEKHGSKECAQGQVQGAGQL